MRVVNLYNWAVAAVEWQLDPNQGFNPVGVWCPCSSHVVPEAAGAGVDVERVLHGARLPPQEHNVERGVPPRRYNLQHGCHRGGGWVAL